MLKTKLNYHDRSDWVLIVTEIKENNDMMDHTDAVYAKNKTNLSLSIKSSAFYDEN